MVWLNTGFVVFATVLVFWRLFLLVSGRMVLQREKSTVSLHLHSTACIKHTEKKKAADQHCALYVNIWLKIKCFTEMEWRVMFSVPYRKYWQQVSTPVLQRMEGQVRWERGTSEFICCVIIDDAETFCCCQRFPQPSCHSCLFTFLVCIWKGRGKKYNDVFTLFNASVSSQNLLSWTMFLHKHALLKCE